MRLSDDLFQKFVGPGVRMGEYRNDNRKDDRFPYQQRTQFALLTELTKLGAKTMALVRDISRSGAGMLVSHALPPGAELVLWLKDRSAREIANICRVVRCVQSQQESRLFMVGLRFVEAYDAETIARREYEANIARLSREIFE